MKCVMQETTLCFTYTEIIKWQITTSIQTVCSCSGVGVVSSPVVGGVTDPHHHFAVPTRQTLVVVGDLGTKGLISHRNRGVNIISLSRAIKKLNRQKKR